MQPRAKLAAIDLDGTLLGPDKRISPENLAALKHLAASGTEIVAATGRHLTNTLEYVADMPGARWAVTCQGAAVHEIEGGRSVHGVFLSPGEAPRLVELGRSLGFASIVYHADRVRRVDHDSRIVHYTTLTAATPVIASPSDLRDRPTHKVIWLGEPEAIARLPGHPEITALPLYHVRTQDHLYEFLPGDATKALGVARVAERLGIGPDRVVAFGDADNDIPLFHWAGRSYAMSHGTSPALEAAGRIAPPGPPESAFARAVDHFLAPAASGD